MDKNEDSADVALMLHHDINERVMTALVELLLYEHNIPQIVPEDTKERALTFFSSILKQQMIQNPDINFLIGNIAKEYINNMLFSMSNFQYQLNTMIENEVREQLKKSEGIIR